MFRLLCITLYIFQNIAFTHSQYAQHMPKITICSLPGSLKLQCPVDTIVIIRNAYYGIPVTYGSCGYKPGDCISDAMIAATSSCTTDSTSCSPHFNLRKLSDCDGRNASYAEIEYDCVPIHVNDTAKIYDVCQTTADITSDHGIIQSPGYPTQFQKTTKECMRAIHVPDNKQVRLWVTDLYISLANDCNDDHLYVVDNFRTYRHCGLERFVYPDLCASTILIQYFVNTEYSSYRGLRLYFEIVDRVPTDVCPNGTVTPVPLSTPSTTTSMYDTTTEMPTYAQLGIASNIISFQLCPSGSYNFSCPNNYGVVIRRNIYGYTDSNQCDKHKPDDCISIGMETNICTQSCSFSFFGHAPTGECNNRTASYQYIEYQCIPTKSDLISNSSCPVDGSAISVQVSEKGRFQSYGYPHIKNMNCLYNLKTTPGYIMNFYAITISLTDQTTEDCPGNRLILTDKFDNQDLKFCGNQHYKYLFSSCSEEVKMIYTITDDLHYHYGVELYIEVQHTPTDGRCGQLSTTPSVSTLSTTIFTTPTATPHQNQTNMTAFLEDEYDICFSRALSRTCPSDYTFMLLDAYYGVKSQASNPCAFIQGDCTQNALPTISGCPSDSSYCFIPYYTKLRLAQCSDYDADYLHVRFQCVPSKPIGPNPGINVYDICDTGDIIDTHGILTSPNYPSFQATTKECFRKLLQSEDRVLKIWILDVHIGSDVPTFLTDDFYFDENGLLELSSSSNDACSTDYLQINTPHDTQRYCGTRKLAIAPVCAKSVDFHYNAISLSSLYTGFKLYFEWVEKPANISCGGDPIPGSTTTPPDEPLPPWAQELRVSPLLDVAVCFGTSTTIRCPRGSDYVLSIIHSSYSVTGSGQCEEASWSHCSQTFSLDLPCSHQCHIEYLIPQSLSQCNSSVADYMHVYYECIPTILPNQEEPIDICSSTGTETIAARSGILVSPQYPTFSGTHSCSKKIQTVNSKLWTIFIVDIYIDGNSDSGSCDASSLSVFDGDQKITLCGSHKPEYLLLSCSSIIEFEYKTTHSVDNYRGFKMYFESTDVPPGWACTPSGFTTVTTTPQPPPTTTKMAPSLRIAAYGGTTNGTRQYCTFPFTYQGQMQTGCVKLDPPSSIIGQNADEPWCSLTSNFDADKQWGYCDLGVTDKTMYDICQSSYQLLECPVGYVIDLLTVDYAAKPDGSTDASSCRYDQNDCFQNDLQTRQTICAGLTRCSIYHTITALTACQDRKSAYLHVDYTCVPRDSQDIIRYDICSASHIQPNTVRGFIVSPNYPNTPSNPYDCTFNLTIDKPHQDIYLYVVNMRLTSPHSTGQTCNEDRFLVTADGVLNEICGMIYTNLLVYTCHETIILQFIRKAGASGYGFQLYFEFRDKPPLQLCPSIPTTTTVSTISPTIPTTTRKPDYYPAPSKRMFRTLCFPETSSSLDGKDFQCPDNYVMVIHRALYGSKTASKCIHEDGDCVAEASIVQRLCAGKQSCTIAFVNPEYLDECSLQQATYLFVDYQCLPTPSIISNTRELCNAKLDDLGTYGILTSASYPTYTQTLCSNSTLSISSNSDLVIHLYLLDMNIGPIDTTTNNCTNDYLIVSYQCNNQLYTKMLCGSYSTELLVSTCDSTDSIFVSYALSNKDIQDQRGFALVFQLLPKSGPPTGGPTSTPAQTTTPHLPGPGPLSTNLTFITKGVSNSLIFQCDESDYVLIIHKAALAVSQDETCRQSTKTCQYSPNDCFQDYSSSLHHCGGHRICHQVIPSAIIHNCNSSQAHYVYIEYQCVPTRPKVTLDICSAGTSINRIEGGALLSTTNYKPDTQLCKVLLQSNRLIGGKPNKAFRIYIISLELPRRATLRSQGELCSETDPFIDIDDHEVIPTRLCGYSHGRYVFETCSNMIEIRLNNTYISTSTIYHGFKLYFESVTNELCINRTVLPPPTEPYEIRREVLCTLNSTVATRADFSCTLYHGLVFLQSQYFVRSNPDECDVSRYVCHYPSAQPEQQCAGESVCSYTHVASTEPGLSQCGGKSPDAIEFYYQCLPMNTNAPVSKYAFCDTTTTNSLSGFIDTKHYPNSYEFALKTCSLTIQVPEADRDKNYSIYLYIYELSIRDDSALHPPDEATGECVDELIYTDGNVTESICMSIDQPLLQFYTSEQQLELTFNYSSVSSSQQTNIFSGARLFFYIGNQSLPEPVVPVTTPVPHSSTKGPRGSDSYNPGLIAALVVVAIVVVVLAAVAFVYYRRRLASQQSVPPVRYDTKDENLEAASTKENISQQTSIPRKSFGDKPHTFISPYYDPNRTVRDDEIEDETDT